MKDINSVAALYLQVPGCVAWFDSVALKHVSMAPVVNLLMECIRFKQQPHVHIIPHSKAYHRTQDGSEADADHSALWRLGCCSTASAGTLAPGPMMPLLLNATAVY
jgi:hypothetical protein